MRLSMPIVRKKKTTTTTTRRRKTAARPTTSAFAALLRMLTRKTATKPKPAVRRSTRTRKPTTRYL